MMGKGAGLVLGCLVRLVLMVGVMEGGLDLVGV